LYFILFLNSMRDMYYLMIFLNLISGSKKYC